MTREILPAQLRPRADGHFDVFCGRRGCSAPIGVLEPPYGWKVDPYDRPRRRNSIRYAIDWTIRAPENPTISAARGLAAYQEGRQVIYTIIRPKPKRDRYGRIVRDDRGQPVPRQGGSRPSLPQWAPEGEEGTSLAAHHVYGHIGHLPAIIECWRCQQRSRVPDPVQEPV